MAKGLTKFNFRKTYTSQSSHEWIISLVGGMINTCVIMTGVHWFVLVKDSAELQGGRPYSFIADINSLMMFGIMSQMLPLVFALIPKNCCFKRKFENSPESVNAYQFQVNERMCPKLGPAPAVGLFRAFTVWFMAMFYYSVVPLAMLSSILATIGNIIMYRIGLTFCWRRPAALDKDFIYDLWSYAWLGNLWVGFGYMAVSWGVLKHDYLNIHFGVMIASTFLGVCLPWERLYRKNIRRCPKGTYAENRYRFLMDYERANPLYFHQKNSEHLEYLETQTEDRGMDYDSYENKAISLCAQICSQPSFLPHKECPNRFHFMNMYYTSWNIKMPRYQLNLMYSMRVHELLNSGGGTKKINGVFGCC